MWWFEAGSHLKKLKQPRKEGLLLGVAALLSSGVKNVQDPGPDTELVVGTPIIQELVI